MKKSIILIVFVSFTSFIFGQSINNVTIVYKGERTYTTIGSNPTTIGCNTSVDVECFRTGSVAHTNINLETHHGSINPPIQLDIFINETELIYSGYLIYKSTGVNLENNQIISHGFYFN